MSLETPLPHLPRVQALRGLAAAAVTLSHLHVVEARHVPRPLLGNWAELGLWGVDLFFVISGFIMVYVTWSAPRTLANLGDYLVRRTGRIYPLYWAVSAALLLVWLWRPDMVFASNNPDILRSFLLIPQPQLPLLAVGWTLVYEMYFYIVFGGLLLLPRRALPFGLLAWAAVLCLGWAIVRPPASDAFAHHIFNPIGLEFVAGALVGWIYVRGSRRDRPWLAALALAATLLLLGSALRLHPDIDGLATDWVARTAWFGSAAVCAFAAMLVSGLRMGRAAVWLGDISYSLYLTHVLTLSAVGRLLGPHLGEGMAGSAAMLALLVAATLAVARLTHAWIERPAARLLKRLRPRAGPSAVRSPS